ncbi:MAG: CoA pyrophosphatase [Actinomycetota bacterium]|nr:CoA pyrophosphatase [Actinomycetota bacterium]
MPAWLAPLAVAARDVPPEALSRFLPPPDGGRQSAVLILFGEGPAGPDLLLIERASTMRSHAGQPAFPGGGADPGDTGPVDTALREAVEEVGLDPAGVQVLATLPGLYLPPSGYVVTPVLAWWHSPSPVWPADPEEVAAVHRVPVAALADPANRMRVGHPSGWLGPAFDVNGMLVWGFTAGLVDRLLALAGWERAWDTERIEPLPAEVVELALRTRGGRALQAAEPVVTPATEPVAGARAADPRWA